MKRREATQLLLASAVASRASLASAAPSVSASLPDVAVVGAGSFGAWTAHALRRQGHRVTLIDAYGPGNSRATSGDESRIIRMSYGSKGVSTGWAKESLLEWQRLSERSRQPVFENTGALAIGARDGEYLLSSEKFMRQEGIRFEWLDHAEIARRYPQFGLAPEEIGLYEPDSGALRARRGIQLLVAELQASGMAYRNERIRPPAPGAGRLDAIVTESGEKISAGAYVFACGPWLARLFPDLLGGALRTPRAEVYYFGSAAGDPQFKAGHFPAWFDVASPSMDAYGVPDLDERGMKIGTDAYDEPTDPDAQERTPTPKYLEATRAYMKKRFPRFAGAPVLEARVCQYENTPTENYLLDRHPRIDNLWLAGGGSGHGFKNGPAVGRYVADLLRGEQANPLFTFAALNAPAKA